jgi:hypothetical protein
MDGCGPRAVREAQCRPGRAGWRRAWMGHGAKSECAGRFSGGDRPHKYCVGNRLVKQTFVGGPRYVKSCARYPPPVAALTFQSGRPGTPLSRALHSHFLRRRGDHECRYHRWPCSACLPMVCESGSDVRTPAGSGPSKRASRICRPADGSRSSPRTTRAMQCRMSPTVTANW